MIVSRGNNKREPDYFEIVVEPEGAKLVVRIFTLYRDGLSCRSIAKVFNQEVVPPPRANTKHRKKGWVMGSIHAILRNEAYVGRWTFMKREWRKLPGTNSRRYRRRPDEQVLVQERPHLRLIDNELWNAVKRRMNVVGVKYAGKGPVTCPARHTNYPLSGLLVCGSCRFPMVIAGGSPNRIYKCSGFRDRGICENGLHVREDVVRWSVFKELKKLLLSEEGVFHARKRIAERLGLAVRAQAQEERRVEAELNRVDVALKKLVSFIASGDDDPLTLAPVREALRENQVEKAKLEQRLVELRARHEEPVVLPSPDEVRQTVFDLETAMMTDPTGARAVLARLFRDGIITLEPQPDGKYLARSEVLPLMLIPVKTAKPRPGGAEASVETVYSVSCAGRI